MAGPAGIDGSTLQDHAFRAATIFSSSPACASNKMVHSSHPSDRIIFFTPTIKEKLLGASIRRGVVGYPLDCIFPYTKG
jgi:hypothetical protein